MKTLENFLQLLNPSPLLANFTVFPLAERGGNVIVTEEHCHAQLRHVPEELRQHVVDRIPSLCGNYDSLTPENVAFQQVLWCAAEAA